ncbi:hypothetical protein AgCh_014157 [Apium graveolens]
MRSQTVTQRVEQFEGKFIDMEREISEMVSKEVNKAVKAMHHSLSEMVKKAYKASEEDSQPSNQPDCGMVHEATKIDELHVKNKVIGMITQLGLVITLGTKRGCELFDNKLHRNLLGCDVVGFNPITSATTNAQLRNYMYLPGLKYEYTGTKKDNNLCPKKTAKNGEKYPSAQSYDMRSGSRLGDYGGTVESEVEFEDFVLDNIPVNISY